MPSLAALFTILIAPLRRERPQAFTFAGLDAAELERELYERDRRHPGSYLPLSPGD